MRQTSPIYMSLISSQTRFPMSKWHTHSNILKVVPQWLCHSDKTWRSTHKTEVCILKWGPTPEVSSLMMVDRTFLCLGVLFQISTSCTFFFHISITKALFFNPLFLLLTLKAYCLSKKKKPLSESMPACVEKWAGNLPQFVCWNQHTVFNIFPTESQD